jgi:hypothetical protein
VTCWVHPATPLLTCTNTAPNHAFHGLERCPCCVAVTGADRPSTTAPAQVGPKFSGRSAVPERRLDPGAEYRVPAVQALRVDAVQDLDGVPAHSATSVAGTPPFSQVLTAACRRSYGTWTSGEAATSGVNTTPGPSAMPARS